MNGPRDGRRATDDGTPDSGHRTPDSPFGPRTPDSPFGHRTPALLRVPDVARRLGLSSRRVRQLLRERRLPGVRQGGIWLVPAIELDLYLVRLRGAARANIRTED